MASLAPLSSAGRKANETNGQNRSKAPWLWNWNPFTVRHLSKIGFIFSTRPHSLALLPHKRKEVKTKRREWGGNWKWTSVCERRLCKHILSHIISCNWLGIRSSVLFSISQQIYETAEPVWAIIIFIFHLITPATANSKRKRPEKNFHIYCRSQSQVEIICYYSHCLVQITFHNW